MAQALAGKASESDGVQRLLRGHLVAIVLPKEVTGTANPAAEHPRDWSCRALRTRTSNQASYYVWAVRVHARSGWL
jgi:hypothetical protein